MITHSRRDVLRAFLASGVAWTSVGCARTVRPARTPEHEVPATATPADAVRAHHIVRITLDGGFDSVMTVDPKELRTAGEVDVLYRADERVQGERRLFGPLIGGLARHDRKMCIVHGVRHDTVAHDTGEGILRAGRKRFTGNTRPFGDVTGELLAGTAPIHHLHIQTGQPEPFSENLELLLLPGNPTGRELPSPGEVEIGAGIISSLFCADEQPAEGSCDAGKPASFVLHAWFADLKGTLRDEAKDVLGANTEEIAAYQRTLERVQDVSRLLGTVDRRSPFRASPLGPGLQLALHAIRENHARFVTVRSPRTWLDTHTDNVALQTARIVPILNDIADFVDVLQHERGIDGPLIDRTTIVIHSELGRFPKLNVVRGKDHWPENSWILLGRGVRGGLTIGATDAQFRGVSVGYSSGRLDAADRRPLDVDALFATVHRIAGGNLAAHGYDRDSVVTCILEPASIKG